MKRLKITHKVSPMGATARLLTVNSRALAPKAQASQRCLVFETDKAKAKKSKEKNVTPT